MKIRILYCRPCGYQKRAHDLAEVLRQKFDALVEVAPGKLGHFEVFIDDKLVASRGKTFIERLFNSPPNITSVVSVIDQYKSPREGEFCELPEPHIPEDNQISPSAGCGFTPEDAKRFYDRFGTKQDLQIYENKALECLLVHANFENAKSVFEFGCGTGRLAERLLQDKLSVNAQYVGVDISTTMLQLTQARLSRFSSERAAAYLSDGSLRFKQDDGHYDRFVATYVLDLLPAQRIHELLKEAQRLLMKDGLLCIVGLTEGTGLLSRFIARIWKFLYSFNPQLVGGCRPLDVRSMLDTKAWHILHSEPSSTFGICSEILVARRI